MCGNGQRIRLRLIRDSRPTRTRNIPSRGSATTLCFGADALPRAPTSFATRGGTSIPLIGATCLPVSGRVPPGGVSVPQITSADNPRFRALLKLHQSSRERRKAGLSLLDGVHLVAAYLEHRGAPQEIVVSRSHLTDHEIASLLQSAEMPEPIVLTDALFRLLSSVATPTGVIAVVKTPRESAL